MSDIEKTPEVETPVAVKPGISVLSLVTAGLFLLAYAYFVYQAVQNLIELPKSYNAIGLSDSVPWVLLIVGLIIPILLYVVAFAVGLRRGALDKAIIFVMGLAVAAGWGYAIVAIHRLTFNALFSTLT